MSQNQNNPTTTQLTGAAGEGAGANPPTQPAAPPAPPPRLEKAKQVRVICEGTLGPKLLEKGAVTGDPEYVALLNVRRQKKVELVK